MIAARDEIDGGAVALHYDELNRHAQNRVFALTILRIWIAYRVGAMRHGVFTFVKV